MNYIKTLQNAVSITCSIALALMSTIVLMQVINRNIFGGSFKWVEELAGLCMIWITFLGAALASTINAHTRIEIFVELLPKPISKLIFSLGDLSCAIFSIFLSWYSYPLIIANLHTMSPAMKLPLAINYLIFFISTILIAIFYLLRAKIDLKDHDTRTMEN